MKVILNKDINHIGEEGDVKEVARGFARNYLFPRELAFPFTPEVEAMFESRKAEIETRKQAKRDNALSVKEKLEKLTLVASVPAGPNGRLYGAVSATTIMELLAKEGFEFERKKIEVPGIAIKSVGNYKVNVKLYENASAEISVSVKAQDDNSSHAEDVKAKDEKPNSEVVTPEAETTVVESEKTEAQS